MINNQMNISMLATKMVLSGYEPANCIVPSGKRVAIIVPFRDDGSKGTLNNFKRRNRGIRVNSFQSQCFKNVFTNLRIARPK